MTKKYRFFYHYHRQKKMMSMHFRGKCYATNNIICLSPCQTQWKKTQPYLVMEGFTTDILVTDNCIAIK